jgi:hypothetical protein
MPRGDSIWAGRIYIKIESMEVLKSQNSEVTAAAPLVGRINSFALLKTWAV